MNELLEKINKFKPINEQEKVDKELLIKYIKLFPNIASRENNICHLTASCWIVNKERTKVLMAYHNIYKSYAWLGGHADSNFNLLEVAIKECSEESGLKNIRPIVNDIYSIEILPVNSHIKKGKFISSHLHLDCCYLLECSELEELKIKEDENSSLNWFNIEDVLNITNEENMKPIYKKLNDKLKLIKNT